MLRIAGQVNSWYRHRDNFDGDMPAATSGIFT